MEPRTRRQILFQIFALSLTASHSVGKSAKREWRTYQELQLEQSRYYDGDSFYLKGSSAKSPFNFRLYGVDCPETEDRLAPERLRQQSLYFGVSEDQLIAWARVARRFTERFLEKEVTAHTCFQDAKGLGKTPRHYAYVEVQGKNLSESLLKAGLARAHGYVADWNGESWKAMHHRYQTLEQIARKEKRGIWSGLQGAETR